MESFWSARRVLVTGGAGFLGSFVVDALRARGCRFLSAPRRSEYDLRDKHAVTQLYAQARPDLVIHLAASVGGIGANQRCPGKFFYDNAIMGLQLIEQARQSHVQKFVCVGTVCSYPKFAPVPFVETDFWNGYPEETNAPYGVAKKVLLVQLEAYRRQYQFNGIYLIPVNLYGPRDDFDLQTSHVIPALIRKCVEAKRRGDASVTVWGSGSPTREFLYVEDAAEGIVTAAERYDQPEPVNVGVGEELTIRALVSLIAELVGYTGRIEWDRTKPDGQPRRLLETSRAAREFGWSATTSLREGLKRTIAWYESHEAVRSSETPSSMAASLVPESPP